MHFGNGSQITQCSLWMCCLQTKQEPITKLLLRFERQPGGLQSQEFCRTKQPISVPPPPQTYSSGPSQCIPCRISIDFKRLYQPRFFAFFQGHGPWSKKKKGYTCVNCYLKEYTLNFRNRDLCQPLSQRRKGSGWEINK